MKLGQGFPEDYIIDRDIEGKPYPVKDQVAGIGNSVVPIMAKKLIIVSCSYVLHNRKGAAGQYGAGRRNTEKPGDYPGK